MTARICDCDFAIDGKTSVFRNETHYCCEACALGHPDGAPCVNSGCRCSSDMRS